METTIKQWVEDPKRSYSVGVALLDKHCANRCLVRYFQNTVERFGMRKLTYELKKLALKVNEPEPIEPPQTPTVVDTPPMDEGGSTQMVDTPPTDENQPPMANGEQPTANKKPPIPEVAAIAKGIVHETWVEISRITEELYNVGTGNDETSMARRRALLEERLPLIERYNQMYEAKEAFFAGEMTEEQLLVIIENKPNGEKQEEKEPVDYTKMSDLELTKKIHSVKQAINRASNQLLYQKDTKGEAPNPMPECQRRLEWEERLQVRRIELDGLVAEFERRGINGNA